jgi:hypothetical protein
MTAAAVTQVEGADTLARTLRQLAASVEDFQRSNTTAAQQVGAEGARRAPRRTGRLASSWRPETSKAQAAIRFGGGGVAYAPAQQWGIGNRGGLRGPHNIRATYFASDALSSTQDEVLAVYLRELDGKVGEVRGA